MHDREKPQANAIIERIHQVLGDMLRTYDLKNAALDTDGPWGEFLSGIAWAVRSTYHTTLHITPCEIVFGRNMIHDMGYIVDWKSISKHKNTVILRNNKRENKTRIKHDYTVGDMVLLRVTDVNRKLNKPTEGPFKIQQVYTNGTVRIQRGVVSERINIRRLRPYFQ